MARPILYLKEVFDEICLQIALGKSLRKITKQEDMPSMRTFYRWLKNDKDDTDKLCRQYEIAKQDRADSYAEDLIEISETEEDVQRARLKIDVIKWLMGKHHSRNYGDKSQLEVKGGVENTLTVKLVGMDHKKQITDDIKS